MESFAQKLILVFFTACGIVLGAALIGSLAAIIVRQPPVETMIRLAREIKIWAIIAAIGGVLSTVEIFESVIFRGEVKTVVKQLLYILSGFSGAELGHFLILALAGEK